MMTILRTDAPKTACRPVLAFLAIVASVVASPVIGKAQAQDGASPQAESKARMTSEEFGALVRKFARLGAIDCSADAASGVTVKVHFRLNPQGYLVGQPVAVGGNGSGAASAPIQDAAVGRAISAIERGQPYTDVLRPEHYAAWRELEVVFSAKRACAQK